MPDTRNHRLLSRAVRGVYQVIESKLYVIVLECGHQDVLCSEKSAVNAKIAFKIAQGFLIGRRYAHQCALCLQVPHTRTNPQAWQQMLRGRSRGARRA